MLRAVTFFSAILVSLTMLAVNLAFELAGSVPDIDGCGFLAGSLVVLLLLYPVISATIASRAARFVMSRTQMGEDRLLRFGGRVGGFGAFLYFGLGFAEVLWASHSRGISASGWAAAAVFTGVSFLGGRLGALVAILRTTRLASQETGT
jgi:hypothetical protein